MVFPSQVDNKKVVLHAIPDYTLKENLMTLSKGNIHFLIFGIGCASKEDQS